MKIPYVIDNQNHRLVDILNAILPEHRDRSLDVATAYFTVRGFGLVREGLKKLGGFRLLLGAEPTSGEQLGLRPDERSIKGLIRKDLEALPFGEEILRLVEDLVAFLRRDTVAVHLYSKGFLHAKCWLFYSDRPGQQMLFDRFRPILAIVGSSNFTGPGLSSNRELNLTHKVLLDPEEIEDPDAAYAVSWLSDFRPSKQISLENRQLIKSEVGARAIIDLEAWYERQWQESADFKKALIELLDASKFGEKEYTPYQVYMKALFEYFKDELEEEAPAPTRSAVELAEFQEDAVKKARKILARYDGVMIADSVGLGKTWIGKKLLEDFAYHLRQKALVVCPASLREMWQRELREATIPAAILSQEELGREEFEPQAWADTDVVLIDESHNFRNRTAQRYENLERLLGGNRGRGRDGGRSTELRGKKVLIFSYFKDTARYLYRHLGHPDNEEAVRFCEELGNVVMRRMDSGADPKERERLVQGFAPKANDRPEWAGTEREIDILISTDVLSEGQNLQDCGLLINYDLHWNPTRMVQRAGRIDRIGTEFDTLWIYNMYPDEGLERLLGLVESLSRKIADIDQAGFLDASVLGEVVHPRNFNTLRRIREEDNSVIEEEEQFTELASNEFLLHQLRNLLGAGGQEMLDALPDGIHSGLAKEGVRGVFFYFQAESGSEGKMHFWKYYDLKGKTILDNRYLIANLIACERDTPRVVDPDIYGQIFELQERVIKNILEGVQEQKALEVAPRTVDPLQQTLATVIQGYINNPEVDRQRAIHTIRFLNQPMLSVQIRELRNAYKEFQSKNNIEELFRAIDGLREQFGSDQGNEKSSAAKPIIRLTREDLRLICFDVVTS